MGSNATNSNQTNGTNLPLFPQVKYLPGASWTIGRQRGQGPLPLTHKAPQGLHPSTTQPRTCPLG